MRTTEEELDCFTEFVRKRLLDAGAELSLDELFDLWQQFPVSG